MKKWTIFLLFAMALGMSTAWSQAKQSGTIKGILTDKTSKEALPSATIALLHAKDSTVAATALTSIKGAFEITGLADGNYRLFISFMGFQPYTKNITINPDNKLVTLDTVALPRTGVNLNEVEIIREVPPIVVKKDTLEFNAGSFKTRENAVVEDLLKKLPGVQVDKDGKITAQGETVTKVLVDGKPFFSDDPKLATKNLPADIIDKIQLIDKKTDQAEFTRIDDGQTEKTINITIKKDKKKGYFGRATAGYGTNDRYGVSASLNRFRDNQQIALLGGGNNVNNIGFTFQDAFNFGGGGGGGGRGGGGRGGGGGGGATGNGGTGITRNWNTGINFSQDFNPKLKLTGNYFYNNTQTESERTSAKQYFLPDTTYYYNAKSNSLSNNINHRASMRVEYTIDSMNSVIFTPNISYSKGSNYSNNEYQSLNTNKEMINSGMTNNTSNGTNPNLSANALYRRRFKKLGRTVSANFNFGSNNSDRENFNISRNEFFNPDGTHYVDSLNQRSDINSVSRNMGVRLTYTEPIFKDRFLELTYGYNRNFNSSDKRTYDYDIGKNIYDKLNDSLSNSFENTFQTQQAGISIRTQKLKYDYSIGLNVQFSNLENMNITKDSLLTQRTTNFFPSATFNYTFAKNKRLRMYYNGSTQQPSVQQLQPVPDNSNPLYIQLGNPNLKPQFNNNFNISYNVFNVETMRGFFSSVNGGFTANKIVNETTFDSKGVQTSRPININGSYNFNAFAVNSFPLKKQNTAINTNTSFSFNRDLSITNSVQNIIKNFTLTQGVGFNYMHKELFDIATNASANYNGARYSVQKNNNTNYFDYTFAIDFNINLPLGIIIGSDVNYTLNTGRTDGYNQNVTMLNAFVSKSVFNKKQGLLKIQGFDLLNQNVSITRNVAQNYIEDVQNKVLSQYFMVSFTYFLNKFGGSNKGDNKNQRMRIPGGVPGGNIRMNRMGGGGRF
jgi:uncharacterized membrane protein YgcG